ncbi:MAG: protein kinase [Caldilineaceae bacterium]
MSVSPQQFPDVEPEQNNNQVAPKLTEKPPSAPADDDRFGDLIGRTIGHYWVEARLGGGAMASVYRAVDQIQKRTVALKVLLPGADTVVRERFRLEARTVSTLAHPNIVATLQIGQTAAHSITYIAMELVEGSSLAELLEQKRQISVVDSCKLLEPIARALAYAHDNAVIHRDVKPSNILLRRVEGNTPGRISLSKLDFPVIPLLSDFGIARSLDAPELTSAGRTIGTPAYMAPEQCAGIRQIDGRADIYALGAVLYRCLVGRPPFVGTTTQILHAHVYDPVTMPQELVAKLPPLVLEILRKTLAKEPDQRYQNAARLADDLATVARLPELPVAPDERTATMATLPVVRPAPTTSQILVPAPPPKASTTTMPVSEVAAPKLNFERERLTPTTPLRPVQKRRERTNWAGVLFGSLLALLPLVVGVVVFASLIPWNGLAGRLIGSEDGTATPVRMPTAAATVTLVPTMIPKDQAGAAITGTVPVTGSLSNPATAPPPVALATPAISVKTWWEDAQSFYASRDWQGTRDKLIFILRTDAGFNKALASRQDPEGELIARLFFQEPPSPFWARTDAIGQNKERIRDMLFNAYIGMATANNADKNANAALEFFNDALALRPADINIMRLRDATEKVIKAPDETRQKDATLALAQVHSAYANEIGGKGDACGALEQLTAATNLTPGGKPTDAALKYSEICKGVQQVNEHTDVLKQLHGILIYSTYEEREYRIYRTPITNTFAPNLLVVNGSQPRLAPDGKTLAFHSMPPDAEGLSGWTLNSNLKPGDRSIRYDRYVEDSKESPPDWNPTGEFLTFASRREGDRVSRVYLKPALNTPNYSFIFGEDPAWQPNGNTIVYKGADDTGNQPGLWLVSNFGQSFRDTNYSFKPLTNVATDRRPTWSPDGKYVVFMSNGRDGNWEIYRATVATGDVKRLTNDPGADGLPTVSPDGKYVAYVSNRGGSWEIWAVPIDGGESVLIGPIHGSFVRDDPSTWLEHAIQWVK